MSIRTEGHNISEEFWKEQNAEGIPEISLNIRFHILICSKIQVQTPLYIYQFTRRHIPEDSSPYQYLCENLKYRSILFVWTN
jgi:hypothetical protein